MISSILNNNDFNISNESISNSTFTRKFTIYKNIQLGKKFIKISELQFPFGSVFNFLDNISIIQSNDKYPVDFYNYKFLDNITIRPVLINVSDIQVNKDIKYRYNKSLFNQDLNALKNKYRSSMNIINEIDKFKKLKKVKYTIVNYNPIFNIKILSSINKNIDKYNVVMNTIINNINNTNEYNNYIFIPTNNMYTKQEIMELLNKSSIPKATFRDGKWSILNSILIFDLITSLLDKQFPDFENILNKIKKKDKTYLIFFNKNKDESFIINYQLLIDIIKENRTYLYKFLTALNIIGYSNKLTEQQKEKLEKLTNDDLITNVNQLTSKLTTSDNIEVTSKEEDDKLRKDLEVQDELDTIKSTLPNEPKINDTFDINTEIIPEVEKVSNKEHHELIEEEQKNSSKINLIEHLEKNLENFINEQDLSTKQKERVKLLFNKTLNKTIITEQGTFKVADLIKKDITNEKINTIHIKHLEDKLLDKSLSKANVINLEEQYMEKGFYKHIVSNLVSFSSNGVFLTDYKEENEYNSFNRIKHITAKFEDINGKRHTIKFKLPIPDSNGVFTINGIKYYMRKQLINLPICKTSNTRVSLISNFNKTLIERKSYLNKSYINAINKLITKLQDDKDLKLEIHKDYHSYENKKIALDYSTLATQFKIFKNKKYTIHFNQEEIFDYFNIKEDKKKYILEYCNHNNNTFIGMSKDGNYLFINNKTNVVNEVANFGTKSLKVINKRFISNYMFLDKEDLLKTPIDYCFLKILDKELPIIFILGYKYGLTNILKELKVKYRLVTKRSRLNLQPNEIPIKFKDFTLVINRYPLFNSLIIAGLSYFKLENYNIGDLDISDTYYQILSDKKISINYLKGIDNFYNFFIDPITFDVLKQLGEPTTPKGLLLRGVELLTDDFHEESISIKHYRLRTLERMTSIMYNEISRQYAQYLNDKKRDSTFSINTESVFLRILQDNSVVLYSNINPIHDIKLKSLGTHLGFSGRNEDAVAEKDRKFPEDGLGIISEATPDNSKVSLNFNLPPNSKIENLLGIINSDKNKNLDPSQLLSVTGLLMPGTINDDTVSVAPYSNIWMITPLIAGTP